MNYLKSIIFLLSISFVTFSCESSENLASDTATKVQLSNKSAGEVHNEVCDMLMSNLSSISSYNNWPDRLNYIETLVDAVYGLDIDLDFMANAAGEILDFSVADATHYTQAEKNFVQSILNSVHAHDWLNPNALVNWNATLATYTDALENSNFTNKRGLRNTIDIAAHSAVEWYNESFGGGLPPTQESVYCAYQAIRDDIDFYSNFCDGADDWSCLATSGVYSSISYIGCKYF